MMIILERGAYFYVKFTVTGTAREPQLLTLVMLFQAGSVWFWSGDANNVWISPIFLSSW